MKYYVVSDIHGFYDELITALDMAGFWGDLQPHKLVVCGDALDRGKQACEVQKFLCNLLKEDSLIFVRGNHEDLFVSLIENFDRFVGGIIDGSSVHIHNGTWDTVLQLANMTECDAIRHTDEVLNRVRRTDFYSQIIPNSVNCFETTHYIFTHGWIPFITDEEPHWYGESLKFEYDKNWRKASKEEWNDARWANGIEAAVNHKILEPGKTIVCGHWHASYGHFRFDNVCSEFGSDADFTPFYREGIIAIDGCTAISGIVNCVVLED